MRGAKVLLNISSVFCFIYGAVYIFSLVFIPIGIYCFIAGKRFSYRAANLDDCVKVPNKYFKNYVIFASIACFPFGMLSIYPYIVLTGNNVKVNAVKTDKIEFYDEDIYGNGEASGGVDGGRAEEFEKSEQDEVDGDFGAVSDEEKREQYEKLVNFNKKGLITDAELEQAREQLFGADKGNEQDK